MKFLLIIAFLGSISLVGYSVLQRTHAQIEEFCKPKGYVGGWTEKYVGIGCIDKDGNRFIFNGVAKGPIQVN